MAFSLHAHQFRHPNFLRWNSEPNLLAVYIAALAIVIIAILVAGISLIEETRSFLPPQ